MFNILLLSVGKQNINDITTIMITLIHLIKMSKCIKEYSTGNFFWGGLRLSRVMYVTWTPKYISCIYEFPLNMYQINLYRSFVLGLDFNV